MKKVALGVVLLSIVFFLIGCPGLFQKTYTLTITYQGTGSVIRNPDRAAYDEGDNVQLTAIPATGWEFSHWSGDLSGSDNPATILMDSNKAVTATFTRIEYEVTLLAEPEEAGEVEGAGTYPHGSEVTVVAIPEDGWSFVRWEEDGSPISDELSYSFTITGDRSLVAFFIPNSLLIDDTHNNSYNFDGYGAQFILKSLAEFAEASGYEVSFSSVTGFKPEDHGAVLIVAPVTAYTSQDKQRVKSLLEMGGTVILCGQWYDYYDNANLNSILFYIGANISFNNVVVRDPNNNHDGMAAWPTTRVFYSHPVTTGLDKIAIIAGTSLDASGEAQILAYAESSAYTESAMESFSRSSQLLSKAEMSITSDINSRVTNVSPSSGSIGLIAVSEVHGGKVVAIGDGSMFSDDPFVLGRVFLDFYDNAKLFENILNW